MDVSKKIKKIRSLLKKNKIDCFLTLDTSNVFYLSEECLEASICVTTDAAVMFVSPLYLTEAKKKFKGTEFDIVELKTNIYDVIFKYAKKNKFKILTLDVASLTFEQFKRFERFAHDNRAELKTAKGMVEKLRYVKNKNEIKLMKKAAQISLDAFKHIEAFMHPGLTEKAVRIELESFLKYHGDLNLAFAPIVASGAASSNPHYTAFTGIIENNKPVLIDQGIKVNGYCSDLTRMFIIGKQSQAYLKIADCVKKAHNKAIKAIKPGVKCSDVDAAARRIIDKAGYSKYFVHSTGHGVGIDVHEAPALSPRSQVILEPGMVLTVEPAVYIPNKYGFREENMVLVTKTGYEIIG